MPDFPLLEMKELFIKLLIAKAKFGIFHLGSTVCIASPYPIQIDSYLQEIIVGETLFQFTNSEMT